MRINNNQRRVLQLQAQQSAYREVIGKLRNFQNTFFDQLNRANFLRAPSLFNQVGTTVSTGGEPRTPGGVTVSATPGATPATYDVRLLSKATAASLTGTAVSGGARVDLDAINAPGTYAFSVNAGGVLRSFSINITDEQLAAPNGKVNAINDVLRDAFGSSSDGGMVRINSDGVISAVDRRSLAISGVFRMSNTQNLDFDPLNMPGGSNSIVVQIGGSARTINFNTIAADHFDVLFDSSNNLLDFIGDTDGLQAHLQAFNTANDTNITVAQFNQRREQFVDLSNGDTNNSNLDDIISDFNQNSFKTAVEAVNWGNGLNIAVNFSGNTATLTTPVSSPMVVMSGSPNNNPFGITNSTSIVSASVSTSATLGSLGFFSGDNATLTINNVEIALTAGMTVAQMMTAVSNSSAGVNMTFSSLTGGFTLTGKNQGASHQISLTGTDTDLIDKLGLGAQATSVLGANMRLRINSDSQIVESATNRYTIDGTTFEFSSHAEIGVDFRVVVAQSSAGAVQAIGNFVREYNKLIQDVFGMLNEAPDKRYHFLTDHDLDEMHLSDRQQTQWEDRAKLGLLHRNSAITEIMSRMRMAMLTSVAGPDGKPFSIFDIRGNTGEHAIRPVADFRQNGQLEFNEQALIEALNRNPEEIMRLFTDSTNGIMAKLESELDRAVSTRLDQWGNPLGILTRRAGLATGISANNNTLHDRIKNLNQMIDTLQARHDRQQDRFWKQFTAMEKQFASLNNQSSHLAGMFGNVWG
jgi:flagellar capping protein FliD